MQPEYRVVQKIKKLIRSRGGWCVKIHGGPYQDKGTPDILACYQGRFLAVEVKTPRGTPGPEQLVAQKQILGSGGVSLITHRVKEVGDALDAIDEL